MLVRIYVNTFFEINFKNNFGLSKKQAETYRECVFHSAYVLMFYFCLSCHFKLFFVIFDTFSPITDYNCHCLKVLNSHQLRFVETKSEMVRCKKSIQKRERKNYRHYLKMMRG